MSHHISQIRTASLKNKPFLGLLFALWLLAAWAVAEHVGQHLLKTESECAFCLAYDTLSDAITSPTLAVPAQGDTYTDYIYPLSTPVTLALQTPGNRDPPALLATNPA